MATPSPKTPKISILKSVSLDEEDPPFKPSGLSVSLNGPEVNELGKSLYESTTSSLTEPPIPSNASYSPQSGSPTNSNQANSTSWDYENYIEKPRGQVAEPRYVSPSSSQDYSARSFVMDQPQSTFTSVGLSPSVLSICAYFFLFLGGLVIMILEKKNLFVVFHAWQSMIVGILAFIIQIVFIWSKSIYTFLWILQLVFIFFMIIRVIKDAPTQHLFKLPVIGDWCEHRAFNKIQRHNSDFYRMS